MDELVPNWRIWNEFTDWYPKLFAKQLREGRRIGLYSCGGPIRSFDTYAHDLLQAWHTLQIGGTWSVYWSFSDSRDANPRKDSAASFLRGSLSALAAQP